MIKILLIDCSRSLEPELRDVYDVHHPPVGLVALATHIEKSDLGKHTNFKIIDSTIDYETYEDLEKIIIDTAPDIVGLRCLNKYTKQFHYASKVAKKLPNKPLVIGGGPYPSAAPKETMEVDKFMDIVVVGEGETVFYDLISAYLNKKPFSDVSGIYYRENGEAKISKNREVIQDLDSIPFPDWKKIDFDRYKNIMGQAPVLRKMAPITTTRGCPYSCTYCHDLFQKRFRVRSAEHLVEELEVLHDLGVHDISIIDDIFNLYPKRVIDIFNLIIKKNLKFRFYYSNGLRGDRMTHEVIDAMVEGGSILFTYALESGSRRIQKLVKKQLRFEPFYEAVDYTVKKGDTAKKIFESLAKLEGQTSTRKAGDICSEKIVRLTPNNTVREAGKKMHEKTIDQIPVFDEGKLKGLVTIDIVNEYTERKDTKIRNVMNSKPPVIDFEFPANALSQLTRISGCVLVEKNSKIIGIITSSDLLKMM